MHGSSIQPCHLTTQRSDEGTESAKSGTSGCTVHVDSSWKRTGCFSADLQEFESVWNDEEQIRKYRVSKCFGWILNKRNFFKRLDFEKNTLDLVCTTPEIRMDFEYEFSGKILLLPIAGNGPGTVSLCESARFSGLVNWSICCSQRNKLFKASIGNIR